jgi:hypothetical protein
MDSMSRLTLIVTATWGLLLGESYFFFGIIRPLAPNIHESIFSAGLKVTATVALIIVWALVMFVLERYYVRITSNRAQ